MVQLTDTSERLDVAGGARTGEQRLEGKLDAFIEAYLKMAKTKG